MRILHFPLYFGRFSLFIAKGGLISMLSLLGHDVLAAGPYVYNAAGDEVTDISTGLVWRRCSVGQTWSGGTCIGTSTGLTHEQALSHAASQTGWRLPNVKELSSLLDTSHSNPLIDLAAFPATSNAGYWTSSPYSGSSSSVWHVNFSYSGSINQTNRANGFFVRLVR